MAEWRPPKRLQFRHHANGRTAEVYLQHDGQFYACEALEVGEVGRSIRFKDNIPTLKLAQLLADQAAHPNCRGTCPAWEADPEALSDPECQAVLGRTRSA